MEATAWTFIVIKTKEVIIEGTKYPADELAAKMQDRLLCCPVCSDDILTFQVGDS